MDAIRKHVLYRLNQWAEYAAQDHARGWPAISSEGRALESALRATETHGIARWRGIGPIPPMPKETRPAGRSRAPVMWGYGPADHMNSLLLDLEGEHELLAVAVRLKACHPKESPQALADWLGLSRRHYAAARENGLRWLCHWVGVDVVRRKSENGYRAET